VVLTMRPLCSAMLGSISSRRSALRRASVPSSSSPTSRLNPAMSAARDRGQSAFDRLCRHWLPPP
jgi:hypothetical protein